MMKKLFGNNAAALPPATDVTAQETPLHQVSTDASPHMRLGWLIVLLGFGGFFLWAAFAPLDKGVPVTGTVTVATNRKAVQHLTGGIIDDILVKDGDTVKAGQVLVKMNAVQATSQAEMTRAQYYTARSAEARLTAERDGKTTVSFPDDLMKKQSDPKVAEIIGLQSQLFSSRQMALRSDLGAYDENIAGLKAQLRGIEDSRASKQEQMRFLKEQLDGIRELAKDGYVARNRMFDLERTYAQLSGAISEDIGNIGRLQRQVGESTLRRAQRQQEYQKEVRTQLADAQKEAETLKARLESLEYDLSNVLVKAPVDGTVVGLAVFTRGGVVPAGFRMMDIVPKDDALIVEGQVPVNLIDKVHKDLPVEMIFAAFNQNKTPHIPGIVTEVGADRLVDEKSNQSFYKIRVQVAPKGQKLVSELPVRPGMPVELFVQTGERTMMSYLFKPVFDRAHSALSEE